MALKLSLDALEALDAIDRRGSFAAAAEALHRVPSALTYTMQKLEQDLGVAVFDRSGHRARLTAAGRALLEQGRQLLGAAADLECRVRRVATGWEAELRIAVDGLLAPEGLLPLLEEFAQVQPATRIRLAREVLDGTWDALASGRADLAIGAAGDGPAGRGFVTRHFADVEFVFAVAPGHALAALPDPLAADDVRRHRAIVMGDTSRTQPTRSVGVLEGQETLTVPDLGTKIAAQVAGLGCGYLPLPAALPHLSARRLIAKAVEGGKPRERTVLAWHSGEVGRALRWFVKRLEQPDVRDLLCGGEVPGAAGAREAPGRGRRARSARPRTPSPDANA
jgi:DNA-binding transcriptional LysR family regulator